MTLLDCLDRRPRVKRGVKVRHVCQWKETSGDPCVVARGEL